jgi:microcin C transport system substrate-binding protein
MNRRGPPFDDVRVREAMGHLLDRRKMNARLMYDQYFLHRSYFEDLYGPDHPCPNPLVEFDKQTARDLLAEAGWAPNPDTGILEKDGTPFEVRFLTRSPSSDKFLAIYSEDLKDVGIELTIDRKDWAAWARDMQTFNFQMTWASWASGVFKDPESMWASSEAKREGGNNVTGFIDDRVDELIEQQKELFDIEKRNAICREIDQIVYQEHPYVLLWNINATRLLYWNRFGTPLTVLSKFGDERSAYSYWWFDPEADAALQSAMDQDQALPARSPEVDFDERFRQKMADEGHLRPTEETDAGAALSADDGEAEAEDAEAKPLPWSGLVVVLVILGVVVWIIRK